MLGRGFTTPLVGSGVSACDPSLEGEEGVESESRMLALVSATLQSNQGWGNSGVGFRAITVTQVGGDTHRIPCFVRNVFFHKMNLGKHLLNTLSLFFFFKLGSA